MLSFLFFQVRKQLLLYLPDRTTKHNNDFRFVLILVCFSATGLREAHTNLIYSLAILVLEYYKVRNVTSCFNPVLSKTELRIRFQQPSLTRSLYFRILTVYLSYMDLVLLLMTVMPFICQNRAQKSFEKCSLRIYEQFSCRKLTLLIQSPMNRIQSLFESSGGSKGTKPIFSNSAKRYSQE